MTVERIDTSAGELARQTERAQLFMHTALGRNAIRLHEVESFAFGVLDVLLSKGLVSNEEISAAVQRVRDETSARGEALGVGVALRVDEGTTPEDATVVVNCEERMPICHSICCKLDFPLTVEEVEAGRVQWDLGRPYHIRHDADGFCTHRDRDTGFCDTYGSRPGICRGYSCAHDTRIWKDFDRMELNTEWIEAWLQKREEPQAMAMVLYRARPDRQEAS
jgi:Fe-S-cluster containining protein